MSIRASVRRLPGAPGGGWYASAPAALQRLAFAYDAVAWLASLGEWWRWQRTALNHLTAPPGATVLELAHGTGDFSARPAPGGLSHRRARSEPGDGAAGAPQAAPQPSSGDAGARAREALPFADARFPAVISTFPTEFITAPETLAEITACWRRAGG